MGKASAGPLKLRSGNLLILVDSLWISGGRKFCSAGINRK
ncbi:hypothetical protein QF038_002181 [Pseudarthrobacter sp. W1I19]|nr:hypothetical protein [Pseudarthrobacter sp. W1I19]